MNDLKKRHHNNDSAEFHENKMFYEDLYSRGGACRHLFRLFVSFDQQSKSKLNIRLLKPYVRAARVGYGRKQPKLLDFGSGWGSLLLKLPRSLNLYCFDLSKTAMDRVISTLSKLGKPVLAAELTDSYELSPNDFDFIVCSHVLEHVDDDIRLLKLFYAALAEDGVLLLNVPINEVWDDPKHVRKYDYNSLAKSLETSGFSVIEHCEADRATALLLTLEYGSKKPPSKVTRVAVRFVRLLLAIQPLFLVEWIEHTFLKRHPKQQLLVLARKRSRGGA